MTRSFTFFLALFFTLFAGAQQRDLVQYANTLQGTNSNFGLSHGNQPIQHMPYLYCYAGQPWKTQYWVRQIMSRLYNATEDGFPGDEDQGGMSSWYVLSALGLYAVCPGTDQYVIGSPLFRKATITLENGNHFTIEAKNNSAENVYIQSATLNGQPWDKNYITYADIARGGTLSFVMGPQPCKARATSKQAAPFSLSGGR